MTGVGNPVPENVILICPHLVGSTLPSPGPTIGGSMRAISMSSLRTFKLLDKKRKTA
jgi:hypothetical protein